MDGLSVDPGGATVKATGIRGADFRAPGSWDSSISVISRVSRLGILGCQGFRFSLHIKGIITTRLVIVVIGTITVVTIITILIVILIVIVIRRRMRIIILIILVNNKSSQSASALQPLSTSKRNCGAMTSTLSGRSLRRCVGKSAKYQ